MLFRKGTQVSFYEAQVRIIRTSTKIIFVINGSNLIDFFTGVPFYIFGHSMGGLIALRTVLRRQEFFRGLILSGKFF